jgi:thioredoxin reductase (NADPH)
MYSLRRNLPSSVTSGRVPSATRHARNVALATGYYDHPNALGVPGEDLPHVSHYWTEAHPFYRRRVVVVGGKNSAAIAALELYRAGAQVTLVHRGERIADSVKYWIKPDIENRIKEGAVQASFDTRLLEIRPDAVVVERNGKRSELPTDAVFLLTGYTPDVSLLREAGARVDPETLVPEHDPETLETSVGGLFVAGALASGRFTSRIFIENGRFHGEAIVRAIVDRQPRCARRRAPRPPRPQEGATTAARSAARPGAARCPRPRA